MVKVSSYELTATASMQVVSLAETISDVTAQIIGRETEDTLPATLVKLLSAAVRFQLVRLQAKIHTTLSRYLDEKALLAFRKFEDPLQRRWLDGLFEAVRTAVKLPGCKGAEASLQAFFWVTRHETIRLPAVEAFLLEEWGRFSSDLMLLFTDGQCPRVPPWFQGQSCQVDDIELAVRRFEGLRKSQAEILVCSSCGRADIPANERAYNHFPFIEKDCGVVVGIGERIWCKQCVERMLAGTNGVGVPWRRL